MIRFWSKVKKTKGCWRWMAYKDDNGYGIFKFKGKSHLAHRVAWFLSHHKWPDSCALHSCDNPACVRPSHLFEGTQTDNHKDMIAKGRKPKGEKHGSSKLSDIQVAEIRKLHLRGCWTQSLLAHKFKVSQPNISRIIHKISRK